MKLVKFAAICAAAVSLSAMADDVSNTIAILPVTKTLTAMPLTVNFTDAAGNALSASNIVKTANLPEGSELYVYNTSDKAYTKYTLDYVNKVWALSNGGKKYVIDSSGQLVVDNAKDASAVTVARGAAVFLKTPSGAATFYVAGSMPGSATTTTVYPGANLIGAPKAAAFALNGGEADFSSIVASTFTKKGFLKVAGDIIQVISNDTGMTTDYYYKNDTETPANSGWGTFGSDGAFTKTSDSIPAGVGFWYVRSGSTEMTISW